MLKKTGMKKLIFGILLLFLTACRPDPKLEGHTYILQDSSLPISLSFDTYGHRYFGQAVNKYFGTYTATQNQIRFSTPQSSMLSGDEDDMQAEDIYLTNLPRTTAYELTEDTLSLTLSDGKHLIFSRRD